MKKFIIMILSVFATTGFAEQFVLDNQTEYATLHIQWASSAREVDEENQAMIEGLEADLNALQVVSKLGRNTVTIPKNSVYFRIIVWTSENIPSFHTNWIEVEPNNTYTLTNSQLVPIALMQGMGC